MKIELNLSNGKSGKLKIALFGASAIAALSIGVSGAQAQETGTAAARETIGDIVVTARKTSEELQTTPVAVSAFNAEALKSAQITTVSDLQKKAPALSSSAGGPGGPGTAFLSIRGQTNSGGNSTSDTAVATYVDGVYFARSTGGNLALFDLAQAEVLRGPQGTLFGRNTTGGALNMTTVQPDGTYGGYVRAEYGNYNAVQTDGAVTIPLQGEELSVRLAGRYASRDGYYENPILGTEVNNLDHFWGLRGTLKWAPESLPFSITLSADGTDWSDSGQAWAITALNTALVPANLPYLVGPGGGGKYDETYAGYLPNAVHPFQRTGFDGGKTAGATATIELDLGEWSLKSITAWRKNDSRNTIDLDGSPALNHGSASQYGQDQRSEELQATTTIGKLDLIGGLMYFYEEGSEESVSRAAVGSSSDLGFFDSESKSLYAQANYSFTDQLRGTAGYRYTWDERNLERKGRSNYSVLTACAPGIPLTASGCSLPLTAEFNYPAWLLGLDYKLTDNAFIYVKASQASLSGGFNTRLAPAGREAFQPEERQEYEVGAKVDAFDNRLRANLAVFTGETDGAQRQASALRPDGTPTQFTLNAGIVETSGAELELTAIPWSGMELNAGVAYLDASYKEGSFTEVRAGGVVVDRSGELVPLSPEWSFNLGATQKFTTSYGVWSAHADYTFFDERAIAQSTVTPGSSAAATALNTIVNNAGILESYSLVSGRLALQMNNGLEFSLWGKNLTDEEYYTYAFPSLYAAPGFGVATQNQGVPLTYGIGVSYDF